MKICGIFVHYKVDWLPLPQTTTFCEVERGYVFPLRYGARAVAVVRDIGGLCEVCQRLD